MRDRLLPVHDRLAQAAAVLKQFAASRPADKPLADALDACQWHLGFAQADLDRALIADLAAPDLDGARECSERTTRTLHVLAYEMAGLSAWQRQQLVSCVTAQVQLRACLDGPKPSAEVIPFRAGLTGRTFGAAAGGADAPGGAA